MADIFLKAENLGHSFGKTRLFDDLSFTTRNGEVLLVRGPNGSGKSTLLRIVSGFLRPLRGEVKIEFEEKTLPSRELFHRIGMCTPEMRLYEELTGLENLEFFAGLRGINSSESSLSELLESVGLSKARHKMVKAFSSGMKQRLKLILSVFHEPPILFLDEPGSNLDDDGMGVVARIVSKQRERGIVILASNDTREFEYGTQEISLVF